MTSQIRSIVAVLTAVVACGVASNASAQVSDSQTFTVTVPSNLSITAPVDAALTHDETDSNQAFPNQSWTVVGNSLSGVTVSFATGSAFVHTADPTYKRDAQLGLNVTTSSGPGTWTVNQATDVTDYVNSDNVATVTASSNGTSSATFALAVSFITDAYGSFPSGDYATTVTGTVTAN
ncbi:MAG: hypothetical protein ACF8CQ_18685 [Rhodopirellula sp. JB044]|uniref:hypothetical protein n=1 Tax=Rhodopirellula sp. JB044 TaxID=3342844 RepID=UPI00370BDBE4